MIPAAVALYDQGNATLDELIRIARSGNRAEFANAVMRLDADDKTRIAVLGLAIQRLSDG